ncbi:hypothetical protein G6M86_04675 [Agrobacterium tumefaciens]|uniref:Uncharacterized protein n=1 Tax=Agrobacterium tumefaciens TaxID=358 RepID=A0AAJ4N096_AGRTU|nr:hypothetical protein G6M86_04675 [Agrobacterium tumefaciens]
MSGAVYDLPTWTATQTLSPAQQAIKDQQDAAEKNLATLANTQSGRLNDVLGTPFTLNGAPAAGSSSSLTMPNYTQIGAGPQLQGSIGNTGNIQSQIAGAGNIQTSVGSAGNIQNSIANAGDITKSYGTDYGANVQQVQDALMARLQPSLDQNRAALEQKLANQGLQPGSEAYDRAYGPRASSFRATPWTPLAPFRKKMWLSSAALVLLAPALRSVPPFLTSLTPSQANVTN